MSTLAETAPAFVELAHRIVWASVATVAPDDRPWSRVLHPIWEWDGERLVGWIGTSPTPTKRTHLAHSPHVAVTYWHPEHDTANAYCRASLHEDDETCVAVWNRLKDAPEPVGYDPAIIPAWISPTAPGFAALRLEPWRLYVQPGAVMLQGRAELVRTWRE